MNVKNDDGVVEILATGDNSSFVVCHHYLPVALLPGLAYFLEPHLLASVRK